MASLARPTLLKQACLAAPSRRVLSTKTLPAFTISSLQRAQSQAEQTRASQSKLSKESLAAFHASSRQLILPPLPQRIKGTLNDPAPVPDPTPAHGSIHWTFERIIAAGLIPLTVAPFAAGHLNPLLDATFCTAILLHSHIGFESIIIDYVPQQRLPAARKLFMWGLRAATVVVGIGLYEFETNDVGLTAAIQRIWHA